MAIEAIGAGAASALAGTAVDKPSAGASISGGEGGSGFTESLGRLLESTNDTASEANSAVGRMLDGSGDVHEAMIALQQADTMLQLTVQVRNKLVQAYQDIMRMPV